MDKGTYGFAAEPRALAPSKSGSKYRPHEDPNEGDQ
jgi:hypothetical protein